MPRKSESFPEENAIYSLKCFKDNEAWQRIWKDIEVNIFTMFSHWEKIQYILNTLEISTEKLSDLLKLDRKAVWNWQESKISEDSLHRMRVIGIPSQIVESIRRSLNNERDLVYIENDSTIRYPIFQKNISPHGNNYSC